MLGLGPIGGAIASLATAVVLSVTPSSGPQSGGTSVTIAGLNFASAATVKFGQTAPTGVSVVSATSITGTTAACDSHFVDDVTVMNTATDKCRAQCLYDRTGSAPQIDPATLPNSMLVVDYTGSAPWVGVKSAPDVSSVLLTRDPRTTALATIGTAVNGFNPAVFDSTLDQGLDTTVLSSYLYPDLLDAETQSTTGFTALSLVWFVNAAAPSAAPETDPGSWSDYSGYPILGNSLSTNGVAALGFDGGHVSVVLPCTTGAWHLVVTRANGTQLLLRLDGANGTPAAFNLASASAIMGSGQPIAIGKNAYRGAQSMQLLFQAFSPLNLSDAQVDGIGKFLATKFAISLGATIAAATSVDPATISQITFWIASYAGDGWAAVRNTTNSEGNDLVVAAGGFASAPTAASLNSHGVAVFDGVTNGLQATRLTKDMLGTDDGQSRYDYQREQYLGWSMTYLANFTSLPLDGGAPYNNPNLFTDPQAVVGICASSDVGYQAFQIDDTDGVNHYVTTPGLGAATATWTLLQGTWDGVNKLRLRKADGTISAFNSVLCRPRPYDTASGRAYVGLNYTQAVLLAGKIAFGVVSQRVFSAYTMDGIGAWAQVRYALSLGFTTSTNYTKTINESVTAPTIALARRLAQARATSETLSTPSASLTRSTAALRAIPLSISSPSDTLTHTGSYARGIGEGLSTPGDGLVRSTVASRGVPESPPSPSDLVVRLFAASRPTNETVPSVADAITRVRGAVKSISESLATPSDGLIRVVVVARSTNESFGPPSDSVARALVQSRGTAESMSSPSDSIVRAATFVRPLPESLSTPSDALTRLLVQMRAITEATSQPGDAVARATAIARACLESLSAPNDSIARSEVIARASAEVLSTPTAGLTRSFVGSRSIPESVPATSDAVARLNAQTRATAESISPSADAIARSYIGFRSLSETLSTPADAVVAIRSGAGAFTSSTSETLSTAADSLARLFTGSRSINESMGTPAVAIARGCVFARSLPESFGPPSDNVVRLAVCGRTIALSVSSPSDLIIRGATAVRNTPETLATPSDTPQRTIVEQRGIPEALSTAAPTIVRSASASRGAIEVVGSPSDGLARSTAHQRAVGESLATPSAVVTRSIGRSFFISETIPASSLGLTRLFASSRSLSEILSEALDSVTFLVVPRAGKPAEIVVSDAARTLIRVRMEPRVDAALRSDVGTKIRMSDAARVELSLSDDARTEIRIMSNRDSYDVGDDAIVYATFYTLVNGVRTLTDPTTIRADVKRKGGSSYSVLWDGVTLDPRLVRDSLGSFHLTVDCTDPDDWDVFFTSTGAAKGGEPWSFYVRPKPFTP